MTNHPDLVASIFGVSLIGATVVPINARYKTTEMRFVIDDADLVALMTHDHADAYVDFTALIKEALAELDAPQLRQIVHDGRQASRRASLSRAEFDALRRRRRAGAAHPRRGRAAARHRADPLHVRHDLQPARRDALARGVRARRGWSPRGIWGTDADDRVWSALPLFHVDRAGHGDVGARPRRDVLQRLLVRRRPHAATLRDEQITAVLSRPTSRSPRPCSRTRTSTTPT